MSLKYTTIICCNRCKMCKLPSILVCVFLLSKVGWPVFLSFWHTQQSFLFCTWWGSARGNTMATIWALGGSALWSGAAELGNFRQWEGDPGTTESKDRSTLHEGKQYQAFLSRYPVRNRCRAWKWTLTQCGLSSKISPVPSRLWWTLVPSCGTSGRHKESRMPLYVHFLGSCDWMLCCENSSQPFWWHRGLSSLVFSGCKCEVDSSLETFPVGQTR